VNWSDASSTTPVNSIVTAPGTQPAPTSEATELAKQMGETKVHSEAKDEEDPLPILTGPANGLRPDACSAEVEVKGVVGIYKSAKTFEDLDLSKALMMGVTEMKFVSPSKIQGEALPIILSDNRPNVIAQAHHGSGKTATYTLGMLSRVDETKPYPQAMCVCPVRELAVQVAKVCEQLGKFTNIKVLLAVPDASAAHSRGGFPAPRVQRPKATQQIVIGTPGTLLAKLRHKEVDGHGINVFVADEADQMVALSGFSQDTLTLKKMCNRNCQILLFSATFSPEVMKFAKIMAPNAAQITVKTEELSLDAIKQFYMDCKSEAHKFEVLKDIYGLLNIGQSIIFVHTVKTAKYLANRMREEGFSVSLLHGKDMVAQERDRVMADFRAGRTTVLITTNVLARGIDVLQVTLVVNYDLPLDRNNRPDFETYIHRIGRSGRFGRKGVAINFVHNEESRQQLIAIAEHFQRDLAALPTDIEHREQVTEIIQNALK